MINCVYDRDLLDVRGHKMTKKEYGQEVIDRINYFYLQTDGSLKFPNSADGDILRMVYKLLTNKEDK